MTTPKGHRQGSCAVEDSHTEIYSKRKALEHLKCGLPKDELSHQDSEEHCHAPILTEISDGFPQKKQKLASPQYGCKFVGVFEEVYDPIVNKKHYGELMQRLDSSGNGGGSHHGSESSVVDSDYSQPSLTNDSRSPRSIASSRSSSRPPDFETESDSLTGDLSCVIFESIMSDEDGTPVRTLGKNQSMIDLTTLKSLSHAARVCADDVASAISLDRKSVEFGVLDDVQTPRENGHLDQSSNTRSESSSNRSHPAASSFSEGEEPSTEGDRSSQSQPSSAVSDSVTSHESNDGDHGGTLQSVIRTVLRTDPDVAEILFRALDGRLECAPPNHNDHFEESSGLDLLSILELQDSSIVQNSGAFTTHGPSSSSGSSSTDGQNDAVQPLSNGSDIGLGGTPVAPAGRDPALPNENSGRVLGSQKSNTRSNPPQSTTPHGFRCVHNALWPEKFRVNHATQERFRSCAGPGSNSIQRLKEHMQSIHTKKAHLLQCIRCQEGFKNQDLLRSHEMNVDCPIRCPECREEFEKKALRQAHQEKMHLEETRESRFIEIDDAMDKKIKESLKAYVDSLKKGKGSIDPIREQWIEANTDRYMIGRSSKNNPKLELGQWYVIFSALSSESRVPEHPFYDYALSPSDLAGEKILLINESMVVARIKIHGPPPAELQPQRDWYQDVLRESLMVAAKTRLVLQKKSDTSSEQQYISNSSVTSPYLLGPNSTGVQGAGYNLPLVGAFPDVPLSFKMTATHELQASRMSSHLPGLGLPLSNFLQNDQQQTNLMTALSSNLANERSTPSGMMTDEITELGSWDFEQNIADATSQLFGTPGNFEFTQDYDVPFEASGSHMLEHTHGQSYWPRQQGKG